MKLRGNLINQKRHKTNSKIALVRIKMSSLNASETFEHSCLYFIQLFQTANERQRHSLHHGIDTLQISRYQLVRDFAQTMASSCEMRDLEDKINSRVDDLMEAFTVALKIGQSEYLHESMIAQATLMLKTGCSIRHLPAWTEAKDFFPEHTVFLRGLLMFHVVKLSTAFNKLWMDKTERDGSRWCDPEDVEQGFDNPVVVAEDVLGYLESCADDFYEEWQIEGDETSYLPKPNISFLPSLKSDESIIKEIKHHSIKNLPAVLPQLNQHHIQLTTDSIELQQVVYGAQMSTLPTRSDSDDE